MVVLAGLNKAGCPQYAAANVGGKRFWMRYERMEVCSSKRGADVSGRERGSYVPVPLAVQPVRTLHDTPPVGRAHHSMRCFHPDP